MHLINYFFKIGDHNLTEQDGEQEMTVCKITNHPNFNRTTLNYDLSILTLCNEITFNEVRYEMSIQHFNTF